MALESATYINGLVSANPSAGDPVSQGDDHMRLIKAAIKNTFPNITGPVTATQAQINAAIPTGLISLWYSSAGTVPAGWGIADGSTYAKSDGSGNIVSPDLRDRFVLGVGPLHAQGTTGGSDTGSGTSGSTTATGTIAVANGGSHSHGGVTGSHVLTTAQMPSHTHSTADGLSSANPGLAGGEVTGYKVWTTPGTSGSAGSNEAHSHTLSSTGSTHDHTATFTGTGHTHGVTVDTVPPYFALIYILKL